MRDLALLYNRTILFIMGLELRKVILTCQELLRMFNCPVDFEKSTVL
jgi:hypothetical protein